MDFLIIGAQKAATTFVQRMLAVHPDVGINDGDDDFFIRKKDGWEDYASRFRGSHPGKGTVGLKCADYLAHPELAARLCAVFPELKLMVVLRDPLSRAVSAYHHFIRYGMLPVVDPEEGLKAVFSGEWDARYPEAALIREYGEYGKLLGEWMAAAGSDRLLAIDQETCHRNPESVHRAVCSFLGLDAGDGCPLQRRRAQAVTYHLTRLRFLRTAGVFCLWSAGKGKLARKLSSAYWLLAAAVDRGLLARFMGNPRPQLSDELRGMIEAYYRDDQKRLGELLPNLRQPV